MMRALPASTAAKAPPGYVSDVKGGGKDYKLYVHSYLGYGLMAGRIGVLKTAADAGLACMPTGFEGKYRYKDAEADASGSLKGPDAKSPVFSKCSALTAKSLKLPPPAGETPCPTEHAPCSFNGEWGSGLLADSAGFHLMSFAAERARQIKAAKMGGLRGRGKGMGSVTLADIKQYGNKACK